MNWDAIGAVGETVGALAVVVSLLYLAIQMRSNARALRAEAYWNAEVVFGQANIDLSSAPALSALIARAADPDADVGDFTDGEMVQLAASVRGTLQLVQAQWLIWKEGALPDEFWQLRKIGTRPYIELPLVKLLW